MTAPSSEVDLISLVIPVFNEEDSLVPLHAEASAALAQLSKPAEIIFIDDGSTDSSWSKIVAIAEADPRVSALRFRRNFGKAAALAAGFSLARGERIITLDADLQDDPAEIPRFLMKADEGFDVVSGWKKVRVDPWHKTIPSRVFNLLVSWMTGVRLHDHNCGFKCYSDTVLDEIKLYGEFHRFTPVLAAARGFRVSEIPVHHRPRKYGQSKYGWRRFTRGLVDLLTVQFLTHYHNRPQHLLGTMGILSFAAGALGMGALIGEWFLTQFWGFNFLPLHQRPLLIFMSTAVLLGVQLISVGLIAELITARNQHEHNVYSVAERRLAASRTDRVSSAQPDN